MRINRLVPAEVGRAWPSLRAVLAVVMLVGLTFAGPVLAQNGATVSVGDYEVSRGDVFTITVEIEDAVDVAAYLVEIGFDPTVVEVQSVTVGDFLGPDLAYEITTFDNTAGTFKVDASLDFMELAEGGVDGDGVLAEVEMEAVGWGSSPLTFKRMSLYDSDSELLDPTLVPGEVVSQAAMEVAPAHPEQVVPLGEFTQTVLIKGAVDLAGYRFTLRSSDPTVVAIKDVELGPFLEANSELEAQFDGDVSVDGSEATVQVAGTPPGADPVDGADGDGVIAIVHLEALAVGDAALTLHNRVVKDTDNVDEVPEALNGLVHVSDVTLSVMPEETLVFVGMEFEVDVHVDENAEGLAAYRFTFAYDPTILAFQGVSDTGLLGDDVEINLTGPEDGVFTFEAVQAEPPTGGRPDGPGDLATITFEAIGEGTSDLDLVVGDLGLGKLTPLTPAVTVDGTATAEICVPPQIISLTATPDPAAVGDTVQFEAVVTGSEIPGEPMVYTWDFGDGSDPVEGSDSASHAYAEAGMYTVELTVENWCGTAEEEVVVTVCDPVEITDVLFDTPVKVNQEVEFTVLASGTEPFSFSWDFDSDGTPEAEGLGLDMASHTYTEVGTYMVTVVASNCSEAFTDTMTVSVTVEPHMIYMPIIAKNYAP